MGVVVNHTYCITDLMIVAWLTLFDNFLFLFQVCYPSTDTEKLEKHIFRMYDSNGDGFIDFREFMLVLYILSSGTPEENLKQIFRIFDINNDKSISR